MCHHSLQAIATPEAALQVKAAQDDALDVLASARQQAAILEQHLQVGRLGSWTTLT